MGNVTKKEAEIFKGFINIGLSKEDDKYEDFLDKCANVLKGFNIKNFVNVEHHYDILKWVITEGKSTEEVNSEDTNSKEIGNEKQPNVVENKPNETTTEQSKKQPNVSDNVVEQKNKK